MPFRTKNEEESHYNREVKLQRFKVAKLLRKKVCLVVVKVFFSSNYFFTNFIGLDRQQVSSFYEESES